MAIPTRQITLQKNELPNRYRELVLQNPLLGRVEGNCKTAGWNEEETRTMQLILAVESNASLSKRIIELEETLKLRDRLVLPK